MCDKYFHLDPILEMYKEETCFGIIFVTGKNYSIYKIIKSGDHYEHKKIVSDTVNLPKKHRMGGQSAQRFCRIRSEKEEAYIKKLGEIVIKSFMKNNNTEYIIKKLIIAGPSEKKNMLAQDTLVQQYFKNKLITMNTPDLNDEVIHNTIYTKTKEIFEQHDSTFGDSVLENIKELMNMGNECLVYGLIEVQEGIKNQELKQIITDENTAKILGDLGKCELIIIKTHKLETFGIWPIGIKYY